MTNSFDIAELAHPQEESYVSLLAEADGAMFTHSLEFKAFLERIIPGVESRYLCAIKDGVILAALPAMAMEVRGRRVINSLPFFGSHGGPIVRPGGAPEAVSALFSNFNSIAKSKGVIASTIVSSPMQPVGTVASSFPHTHTDTRIAQITELPQSTDSQALEEELLLRFHKNTRTAIRKSFKSGFVFSEDESEEALRAVYKMHVKAMTLIGGRSKPSNFPDAVRKSFEFGSHYKLYVARHDGNLAAGLLVFFFRDTIEYFMPVTDPYYRSGQPGSGLIFTAMVEGILNNKASKWNWGGTWLSQTGVYSFKKKWGATDFPYTYFSRLSDSILWIEPDAFALSSEFPYFYLAPFPKKVEKLGV